MEGQYENRRKPLLVWGIWSFMILQATSKPPHLVFIVADDLGWNDVGWHNSDMYTPNLDWLAMNGVRLNSSYVQQVCTPSRNCFMTGYYPYHTGLQHGVLEHMVPAGLPESLTTLPQQLKSLGYTTHIVGKWHLGFCNWKYTPTYRGFDSFMGFYGGSEDYYTHRTNEGYDFRWNTSVYKVVTGDYSAHPVSVFVRELTASLEKKIKLLLQPVEEVSFLPMPWVKEPPGPLEPDVIANHAINLINRIDPENQPMFLYLPFQSAHGPLEVPGRYMDLPSCRNIQNKKRRTYCGMVAALDEAVGEITEALRRRGFMENTLIVFTTDNGGKIRNGGNNWPLRGEKGTLWEGGTKGIAFVYSDTLLQKTNYINTGLIHAVDWFPTLVSIAGGIADPGMDGKDQWSMISEGKASARTEFVYNIDELINCAAIRVGKYKLIQGGPASRVIGWSPGPGNSNNEDTPWKLSDLQELPPYMLFDIEADPTEHFDIAEDFPEIVEDMKIKLEKYKESLVPAIRLPVDRKSNPKHFGGNWSPGWC